MTVETKSQHANVAAVDFLRKDSPICPSMALHSVVRPRSPFPHLIPDDDTSSTISTAALTESVEKSVRFNKVGYLKKIMPLQHYTPQEIENCWYSDEEYTEIRLECISKIKMIESKQEFSSPDDCIRGLESRTRSAIAFRQGNREDGLYVVLDEQYSGASVEDIADRYHDVAYKCQLWARAIGRRDEQEAKMCY